MILIEKSEELKAFCARLSEADYVTVDTEFMREKTYYPKLCLVQLGGPDEASCIDPLAPGIDLTPLWALMSNPSVLKVFHAARQDVEIFLNLAGAVPAPLFDTQVAAMVCGFGDSVGYETLVSKLANARVDKSQRFTDWSRRPLTDKQLKYALADVTHLRPAFEKLRSRIEQNERGHWLEAEMDILTAPETYHVVPDQAWKRLKHRSKSRRFLALLREVAAWRETEAQTKDVPRQRVIKDDAVLEIAANNPKTTEDLGRLRLFSKGAAQGRHGQEILAALEKGRALPDDQCPEIPKRRGSPQGGAGPVTDMLKLLLKVKCEAHDVAQKLLANADDLERIAEDDEADVPALKGWRREVFGQDALELKHGRLALAYHAEDKRVRIVRNLDAD